MPMILVCCSALILAAENTPVSPPTPILSPRPPCFFMTLSNSSMYSSGTSDRGSKLRTSSARDFCFRGVGMSQGDPPEPERSSSAKRELDVLEAGSSSKSPRPRELATEGSRGGDAPKRDMVLD